MYLILKDEDNKSEKQIEKDRKSFKRKTLIKRNQNSPEFNQIFRVCIILKKKYFLSLINA